MASPHRCICQHENPDSPYPAGSDGCTPVRRPVQFTSAPDPTVLPLSAVSSALALDAANGRQAPSIAALMAEEAQLGLESSRPTFDLLHNTSIRSSLATIKE